MLKQLYPHKRDIRIEFKEKEHEYIVDGSSNGYISVTTVIKLFFPKFDADRIIDNWMKNQYKWKYNKYYGKTKDEIKTEWKEKGNYSASLGTLLHASIENYYNQLNLSIDTMIEKEYNYFLDFHQNINSTLIPFRTEWYIFDEDYQIAGSIDMVYQDHFNKYHIYDWKRTLGLKKQNPFQQGFYPFQELDDSNWNHYSLQLNLYKYILEKKYNIFIESMNLVCLHPSNDTYIIEQVPNLQPLIQKMLNHYYEHRNDFIQQLEKKDI